MKNKIILTAINETRGKRIGKNQRVAVWPLRGFFIVEDKDRGAILIKINDERIWINHKLACRVDLLRKRIKTLESKCQNQ